MISHNQQFPVNSAVTRIISTHLGSTVYTYTYILLCQYYRWIIKVDRYGHHFYWID
jgi:hypothetical protein